MEGHNVTGIWQVRIYDTGDRWYEENKKKWAKDRALGYTVHIVVLGEDDESILTKDVRLVR